MEEQVKCITYSDPYKKKNTIVSDEEHPLYDQSNHLDYLIKIRDKINFEYSKEIIKSLKIGQISEPLKYPNGYLLLKINDKKEMKQIIDTDKELKDMINFEQNRQLNQFSLLFYKKLKTLAFMPA